MEHLSDRTLRLVTKKVFDIPLTLYDKLLVLYADIAEDERDASIHLDEYRYITINVPGTDGEPVPMGIGYTEHVTNWADTTREHQLVERVFAFWNSPQIGAQSGFIHVFDEEPLITIKTEKVIPESFSRLANVRYTFHDHRLDVVLRMKFCNKYWYIHQDSTCMNMISQIMADFQEIKLLAEK